SPPRGPGSRWSLRWPASGGATRRPGARPRWAGTGTPRPRAARSRSVVARGSSPTTRTMSARPSRCATGSPADHTELTQICPSDVEPRAGARAWIDIRGADRRSAAERGRRRRVDLARRHPQCAVHAEALAVEVVLLDDRACQLRVVRRPAQARRERDRRLERLLELLGQAAEHRGLDGARRDRVDADAELREVARGADAHRVDATLGRGVGDLPDLALVGGHGGGVDD